MSKELYEEALADVKQLQKVAEDNAKRSLIEAVAPRIRELIEGELLKESQDDEEDEDSSADLSQEVPGAPGAPSRPGELVTDVVDDDDEFVDATITPVPMIGDGQLTSSAISTPDEEGKVTLDLDALNATDDAGAPVPAPLFGQDELAMESVKGKKVLEFLESHLYRAGEELQAFKRASNVIKESKGFSNQITRMISRLENMYEYVQESVADKKIKAAYEAKLESYFSEFSKLQERKMSKKSLRNLVNEGDVTLKLTGLPEDIDLSSVGVDLITGEEDEEGSEELAPEAGEGSDEEGSESEGSDELDLGDLGHGDEEAGSDEESDEVEESQDLSDDDVVEIDEGMLRREIMKMKRARNLSEAAACPKGAGAKKTLDNFGGGKGSGDPWLDGEVTTESDEEDDADQLDEADDGIDGTLTMDEVQEDDLDEAEDSREAGGDVAPKSMGPGAKTNKQSRQPGVTAESIKRRISFEKRLQENMSRNLRNLRSQMKRADARRNAKQVKSLRTECVEVSKRLSESVKRTTRLTETLSRTGVRQNGNTVRSAERMTESTKLRAELAESNLFNAKLIYTNKLLQNDSLSKRQKAEIIEKLDEATNLREVKLVYESLSQTLAGTSKPLTENTRRVLGSSSMPTRPASTTLNEGCETERWAMLAGIR